MRGLLMVECLFHQTIKGLKGMTRRSGGLDAVNGRKATKTKAAIVTNPDDWEVIARTHDDSGDEKPIGTYSVTFKNKKNNRTEVCFARYRFGEVLYLKEPNALITTEANSEPHLAYRFDYTDNMMSRCIIKWSNKLFMKAEHGREFVRVTGIKCERLLDISDEDCIAEGIENIGEWTGGILWKSYEAPKGIYTFWQEPKNSFISLYKFANKMKASAEIPNLWVFCYSFEYLPDYKKS